MITSHHRAMPISRNVVERVDRRYQSSLCTAPVLDEAAGLLDAWCAVAVEHGNDMAGAYPGAEWAERLDVVALEMARRAVREPRPPAHAGGGRRTTGRGRRAAGQARRPYKAGRAARVAAAHQLHPGPGRVQAVPTGDHYRRRAWLGIDHRPAHAITGSGADRPL